MVSGYSQQTERGSDMFGFLKRQLRTKTGRTAAVLVLGSLANGILNDGETAGQIAKVADAVLTPDVGVLGALAMLLRDRDAKKDERERNYGR